MRHSKYQFLQFAAIFPAFLGLNAAAAIYYVDINSPNPTPPYTSWATAATNIQDAVNAAVNGNLIMVNPGVYQNGGETVNGYSLSNRVAITAPLIVESTEGPSNTIIQGYQPASGSSGSVRCVYMTNNAVLIGFTLRGGGTLLSGDSVHEDSGGGVWCESTNATIFNCVISGNFALYAGGGAVQGTLQYCTVSQNNVYGGTSYGGGAYDSDLENCTIVSNSIYCASYAYGGGVYNSDVTNSAIADNSAYSIYEYSEGGGAFMGNLASCNITGNSASMGGGTYSANLVNCINYFNTLYTNSSLDLASSNYNGGIIDYSCTAPALGFPGDISSDPQLASFSHISLSSPCRGAGTASATSGVDIDSNPWNNPPSMGCFEPHPGSVLGNVTVGISAPFTNWAPGFALNLQANISGPVYSNVWNFADGTFITNEAYVYHTWSAAGAYPVSLTAYSDSYPAGVTTTLVINVTVPSTYYVNLNNANPLAPYITWGTAAVNIQDAVNVAGPGSIVLVTNGPTIPTVQNGYITNSGAVYLFGGATAPNGSFYRVMVTNPVTVESVGGPASTYILANMAHGPTGCVYLTNGAALNGFTLTNGSTAFGGGICAASTNELVTNCVITGCTGTTQAGAVYLGDLWNCLIENNPSGGSFLSLLNNCVISNNSATFGGGAFGGVLNNCLIVSNTAADNGGGAWAGSGYPLVLNNCLISNNIAFNGGGVFNEDEGFATNCILNDCTLSFNIAKDGAGGAFDAELNNCLVSSNQAGGFGGAEVGVLNNCTIIGNTGGGVGGTPNLPGDGPVLNNCLLVGNSGSGADFSLLNHCTLLQNHAPTGGGATASTLIDCLIISNTAVGAGGGGVYSCSLTNCILADNISTENGGGAYSSTLANCTVTSNSATGAGGGIYLCKADNSILYNNAHGDFSDNFTADPINYCCTPVMPTNGLRNITNAPLFVNAAANDFHLQASSPCINSGNNAYVNAATTTDFDGNPRIVGGTVDIGAYEYQTPTSVISYAYLQQYGLPTDGSVDFKDLDGTGFDVYQDWAAGLNPTNPASLLAMFTPNDTNNAAGIIVSWQSVSGILYNLQRSTNLIAQPPFATIQTNITGQAGMTSYKDGTATSGVPYFYRVSVVAP